MSDTRPATEQRERMMQLAGWLLVLLIGFGGGAALGVYLLGTNTALRAQLTGDDYLLTAVITPEATVVQTAVAAGAGVEARTMRQMEPGGYYYATVDQIHHLFELNDLHIENTRRLIDDVAEQVTFENVQESARIPGSSVEMLLSNLKTVMDGLPASVDTHGFLPCLVLESDPLVGRRVYIQLHLPPGHGLTIPPEWQLLSETREADEDTSVTCFLTMAEDEN